MMNNPLRTLRELKGAPLSIVLALQMAHQRVSQSWLEQMTGYTDKPVSDALSYLQEVGYADHTSSGWQLTGGAVQLPMPLELEEPINAHNPVDNSEESVDKSRNNSDSTESQSVVKTDLVIDLDSDSLTPADSSQLGKIPTPASLAEVRQVLDAAEVLFGVPIVGDPRQFADLDRLLGWIAQAWHGRRAAGGKVTSPAGLICWSFKHGKPPDKKFKDDPGKYLPDSFCRASGQWVFEEE